jgi:hypothetical protein
MGRSGKARLKQLLIKCGGRYGWTPQMEISVHEEGS